jgi:hypothetical protein
VKLHIGSGTVYLNNYVNVDLPSDFCFLAEERPDLVEQYRTDESEYYSRHSDKTLDVLRKGAEVREYVCDRYGSFFFLPVADGKAEEILARSVFEHLSMSEAERALAECRRALKLHGLLRLDVPDHDETLKQFKETGDDFYIRHLLGPRKTKWGMHMASYTRQSLRELVAANGFDLLGSGAEHPSVSEHLLAIRQALNPAEWPVKILWLYKYLASYDFDNWLHLKFAESIKKTRGVEILCYGPDIHVMYPHSDQFAL